MSVKKMLLFPGQGAQNVDMFKGFDENSQIFKFASDILGYDLVKTVGQSSETELSSTELAQPAIFAASLAAFEAANLKDESYVVAGHSLGEYAAMVVSGILDMESGFKAIKARGAAMGRVKGGGMAAVVGLDADDVKAACAEIEGVTPANYNSPQQTVIAGTDVALEAAETLLKEKGAKRFIRLNVSAAFHSEFMKKAADEFYGFAKTLSFNPPKLDFYSNVTGGKMVDFSDMPAYVARHICSPVRFTDELYAADRAGIDTFVEIGPGKVLTGLVKKTLGR